MRILFTGGGSGGHIYPIIAIKTALAEEMINDTTPHRFLYLGPNSFGQKALSQAGIKTKFILAGKLRRYFSLLNLLDLIKIPIGLIQSLWHLFWYMPDVIFSKGGYGSIPVVLAGWIYRIPIVIHESDSIPGLANKLSARFAKKIIVSFPDATKYFPNQKTIYLGNPVRKELLGGNKQEGIASFSITSVLPVILIMGGSQGAKKINEIILNSLPRLLEKAEIIHISGKKSFNKIKKDSAKFLERLTFEGAKYYHLYPFLDAQKLKQAYAVSNLVISRAGAGSISEIAAIGKPSILIPLPSAASNHQEQNAWELAKNGSATILKEKNLTINIFLDTVFEHLNNPAKLKEMSEKVKSFYDPTVSQKIAKEILTHVSKN